jgi:hypothetical protein
MNTISNVFLFVLEKILYGIVLIGVLAMGFVYLFVVAIGAVNPCVAQERE